MEKKFSLESIANKSEALGYKDRILSIINDVEERARVIDLDQDLYKELHTKKTLDSRKEIKEFEAARKDVCDAFGVTMDDEHVVLFDPHRGSAVGKVEQRAFRSFYVLIDSVRREGFYGEGRTWHTILLNKIIEKVRDKYPDVSDDSVYEGINQDPPTFIVFKGFLSKGDFKEVSEPNRKMLETPLFDKEGLPIETATSWFISGHNLEEMFPPSPEKVS